MEKKVLISVSPYVQKYYINEEFSDLPQDIKDTLRAKIAVLAEKTNAIITIGFQENMDLYIEYKYEDLSYMDEIGMELRIKKFKQNEEQLLKAVKTWYMIYHTPNGEMVREIVIMQKEGKQKKEITDELIKKHGDKYKEFIEALMED